MVMVKKTVPLLYLPWVQAVNKTDCYHVKNVIKIIQTFLFCIIVKKKSVPLENYDCNDMGTI